MINEFWFVFFEIKKKNSLQVTIFYDSILICQHYVLYPDKKGHSTSYENCDEIKQPLTCASPIDQQIKGSVKSSAQPPAEEVWGITRIMQCTLPISLFLKLCNVKSIKGW